MSQIELGKNAGIDPTQISRLETGERRTVSLKTAWKLSRALGITLDDLAQVTGADGDAENSPSHKSDLESRIRAIRQNHVNALSALDRDLADLINEVRSERTKRTKRT